MVSYRKLHMEVDKISTKSEVANSQINFENVNFKIRDQYTSVDKRGNGKRHFHNIYRWENELGVSGIRYS